MKNDVLFNGGFHIGNDVYQAYAGKHNFSNISLQNIGVVQVSCYDLPTDYSVWA